jgi:hypothetical protein
MRSYYKKAWTCAMIATFILFFYTFSFAQTENIKGVQFKDGSNNFRCLKSIDIKTPLRLQFVFKTDKPDVGYVIYQNGSRPIAVKKRSITKQGAIL